MATRDDLLTTAKSWTGYLEKASNSQLEDYTANAGSSNYTIFAVRYCEYFGESLSVYQGAAWCAMFVSSVFGQTFGADVADEMIYGHYAYCPYGVNHFKANSAWYDTPEVGDVIFFTNGTRASHTGIVYAVDSSKVYTVEGNTSGGSTLVANGGGVACKSYSLGYSKIMGYGRPNWSLCGSEAAIEEYTDINAIVWELWHKGILENSDLWVTNCTNDVNIYWLCRKLCHYVRTKQSGETADRAYTDNDQILWDLQYRGIITDVELWCGKMTEDVNVYWLMQKGLHWCRTY